MNCMSLSLFEIYFAAYHLWCTPIWMVDHSSDRMNSLSMAFIEADDANDLVTQPASGTVLYYYVGVWYMYPRLGI